MADKELSNAKKRIILKEHAAVVIACWGQCGKQIVGTERMEAAQQALDEGWTIRDGHPCCDWCQVGVEK